MIETKIKCRQNYVMFRDDTSLYTYLVLRNVNIAVQSLARSNGRGVCGRSLAGIAVSNSDGGMSVVYR